MHEIKIPGQNSSVGFSPGIEEIKKRGLSIDAGRGGNPTTRHAARSKLADGTEITKKTLKQVAWFADNSGGATHPVGQKKPNAFGLYDMHGNVEKWTNTVGVGEDLVCCGGGWRNAASDCESAARDGFEPSFLADNRGFRLCADRRAD